MLMPILAVLGGAALLVWSAVRFVAGAAGVARAYGVSALLIGMVIVGFGTSAPELIVSTMAAIQGNPGLALGNAYGSNVTNIGLILGLTVALAPVVINSQVLKRELPLLLAATLASGFFIYDGQITQPEAILMLLGFVSYLAWSIVASQKSKRDVLGQEMQTEIDAEHLTKGQAFMWLIIGLLVLMVSSRTLVWGAVELATLFGVSDVIIGLTIVAIGTSLPELASSIAAARKGEDDLALGNVIGSNFFNTLAVVGISAAIKPFAVAPEMITRDLPVMVGFTIMLYVFALGRRKQAVIQRPEGYVLLVGFVVYMIWLVRSEFHVGG